MAVNHSSYGIAQSQSHDAIDARCVCNAILDATDHQGVSVTHVSLQRLLYLVHSRYLLENGRGLVSGCFEAWKHGPIHTGAFAGFAQAGGRKIDFRAMRRDLDTGNMVPLEQIQNADDLEFIQRVSLGYCHLSACELVAMAQAKGGAWYFVVERGLSHFSLSLRISNDIIRSKLGSLKIVVGCAASNLSFSIDEPFAKGGLSLPFERY